jgi:hypothetical protein
MNIPLRTDYKVFRLLRFRLAVSNRVINVLRFFAACNTVYVSSRMHGNRVNLGFFLALLPDACGLASKWKTLSNGAEKKNKSSQVKQLQPSLTRTHLFSAFRLEVLYACNVPSPTCWPMFEENTHKRLLNLQVRVNYLSIFGRRTVRLGTRKVYFLPTKSLKTNY